METQPVRKVLVTQWYAPSDLSRREEITACFNHNAGLGFDEVIVFTEGLEWPDSPAKLRVVVHPERLTFFEFVQILDSRSSVGECVFFTNADIKLDPNILCLADSLGERELVCLSRYEHDGELVQSAWCSQDSWVARTQAMPASVMLQAAIPLGVPGCENRFAEICLSAGFRLSNPCLDIRNRHFHRMQVPHDMSRRVFGAYVFVHPCNLDSMRRREGWHQLVYLSADSVPSA